MGSGTPLIDEQLCLIGKSAIDELLLLLRNANDECRKPELISRRTSYPTSRLVCPTVPLPHHSSGDQARWLTDQITVDCERLWGDCCHDLYRPLGLSCASCAPPLCDCHVRSIVTWNRNPAGATARHWDRVRQMKTRAIADRWCRLNCAQVATPTPTPAQARPRR